MEARANARAIRRRNSRISIPWGQETAGAVVKVKRERRELKCKLRAPETSWREKKDVIIAIARNRPKALYNYNIYTAAFFPLHERNMWLGHSWGCSAYPRSLLLPSFLISEVLFLVETEGGWGKQTPKNQQQNQNHLTRRPGNIRHHLFEPSS